MWTAKSHSGKKDNSVKKPKSRTPTIVSQKNYLKNNATQAVFKTFKCKKQALSYIEKLCDGSLKLVSKDLSKNNGSKEFIAANINSIFKMSKTKKFNMYENYECDDKLKLILDIDQKIKPGAENTDKFDDILIRCVDLVNSKIREYDDKIKPEIIIIKSCRPEKFSAHIIYTNVHFENIVQMKCFMMSLNSPLIRDKSIDPNIYRVGCMRMLWNSKLGKSNILDYDDSDCEFLGKNKYRYINDKTLFEDTLITNIKKDSNLIKVSIIKNSRGKKSIGKGKPSKSKIRKYAIKELKKYIKLINPDRALDYNDWIKIGLCIHGCNNSDLAFKLWDDWSKTYVGYSKEVNLWKWSSFDNNRNDVLEIDILKYYAKLDNPTEYAKIDNGKSEPYFETIDMKQKYLLNSKNEKLKDNKSTISKYITNWITNDKIKTLAIKSPYNTGKTSIIDKLLTEYDLKFRKVLFITHRQSLTNELYGLFKRHRFCNYMNDSFDAGRLICQIESLHKIFDNNDPFMEDKNIGVYDLIILDEIESINYHFMSDTIKFKQRTFETMVDIIRKSGKILALDGDFSNRAYDFINDFGESIIINNEIKKDKKKYIFTNDHETFSQKIDDSLSKSKKVVIVSMSLSIAQRYHEKYKDKYRVLTHTSKSDDKNRELLKNVEDNWSKYDLIVYSPSVQSGVSFDIPYFDKMFVILSSKSLILFPVLSNI